MRHHQSTERVLTHDSAKVPGELPWSSVQCELDLLPGLRIPTEERLLDRRDHRFSVKLELSVVAVAALLNLGWDVVSQVHDDLGDDLLSGHHRRLLDGASLGALVLSGLLRPAYLPNPVRRLRHLRVSGHRSRQ